MTHALRALVSLLTCVLCLWAVAACAEQAETITWQEEVLLHSGEIIVVTRGMTLGAKRKTPGTRSIGESNYILSFVAQDGTRIVWENGDGSLRPMNLDFSAGIPHLATRPAMAADYARYQCPNPGYVFFKYDKGWTRITFAEYPTYIKSTNLSPNTEERLRLAKNGFLTKTQVQELVRELDKPYRTIDSNWRSPFGCEKTRFVN